MEDALRVRQDHYGNEDGQVVLILILMEDTLRELNYGYDTQSALS